MIEAVLFDIDGTLVDSNELHVEAWHQVFAGAGHAIERAAIRQQIGKGGDNLVPALLPGIAEGARQRMEAGHGRLFRQLFLPQARPFPEAAALLERVHAEGRRVVLASSASRAELDHYVDLLGVRRIVAASTSVDDVATSKPAPDIFARALAKAGVAPKAALAVGDTPYDIIAARGAGVATIALLSGGFAEAELRAEAPVALYADVSALLADYPRSPLAR